MNANNVRVVFKVKSIKLKASNPLYTSRSGQGVDGYISGIVTELGVPISRTVCCYHRRTKILVATTMSNAQGYYRFDNLIAGVKYFVTSVDENNDAVQYNAVIQDLIVASEVVS